MGTNLPTLTLIYMDGCAHCEAARPEFEEACRQLAAHVRGRTANIDRIKTTFPVLYTPTVQLQLAGSYYVTDPTKTPMTEQGIRVWATLCLRDAAMRGLL